MLASLTELKSYYVRGRDGEIGRINDVCFREDEWIMRYLVVDMEDLDREALLLSAYLGRLNRAKHTLSADIRRELVESTPPFDRAKPLTRQDEQELHNLYGWPVYWWEQEEEITPIGGLWDEPQPESENPDATEETGPQLQFAGDLIGVYGVQAEGDEIGLLQDVIVVDETWAIPYLVVGAAPAGPRLLLATDYVQTIELAARRIHVTLTRDAINHGPVLTAAEPITPELERSLREYYDQYSR
jgi:hypothetical protein